MTHSGALQASDLLRKMKLDPTTVWVMRHRPTEPALRKALPTLAEEHPDIYNAYQSFHGEKVENSLCRASYLASFIGHEPGKALFVGIYRVDGWTEMPGKQWYALENSRRLGELGDRGPGERPMIKRFNLVYTEHLMTWKGKLVVCWPGIERSWWRRAHKNRILIDAIHEESLLVETMPHWTKLVLRWQDLQTLPRHWRTIMAQWRAVYVILDRASGKSYVGSAYGENNLLGRWREYAATGHGDNVELKKHDPTHFQFSILERVSPDMPDDEVIRLEATWKERLGTIDFGLNRN